MAENDAHSLIFCPRDLGFSPTRRAPRIFVLHEKMRASNLALLCASTIGSQVGGAVVGTHVVLEGLAICARGRFPSAFFGGGIEVVRKILGVGVSDLPAAWKSGSLTSVSEC